MHTPEAWGEVNPHRDEHRSGTVGLDCVFVHIITVRAPGGSHSDRANDQRPSMALGVDDVQVHVLTAGVHSVDASPSANHKWRLVARGEVTGTRSRAS